MTTHGCYIINVHYIILKKYNKTKTLYILESCYITRPTCQYMFRSLHWVCGYYFVAQLAAHSDEHHIINSNCNAWFVLKFNNRYWRKNNNNKNNNKKCNVTKITFSCAFTRCLVSTYIMLSIYNPFSLHKMAPYAQTCTLCVLWNNIHVTVFMTGTFSDNPRLVQLTSVQHEDTPGGTACTVVDGCRHYAGIGCFNFCEPLNSEDGGSVFLHCQ